MRTMKEDNSNFVTSAVWAFLLALAFMQRLRDKSESSLVPKTRLSNNFWKLSPIQKHETPTTFLVRINQMCPAACAKNAVETTRLWKSLGSLLEPPLAGFSEGRAGLARRQFARTRQYAGVQFVFVGMPGEFDRALHLGREDRSGTFSAAGGVRVRKCLVLAGSGTKPRDGRFLGSRLSPVLGRAGIGLRTMVSEDQYWRWADGRCVGGINGINGDCR